MPKLLSRWATEAKEHLLKYRPKMASALQSQGKLDEWAENAANRALDESAQSIQNGMSCLEAQSEAQRNHMFLPSEEDRVYFGCRTCYGLTYESAQAHDARVDRLVKNPLALALALESRNAAVKLRACQAGLKLCGLR